MSWMNGRRELPDAQTCSPSTRSPLLLRGPGAEALTQLGRAGRGLVPSLMDSRSARPGEPRQPLAPEHCVPTVCSQQCLQGLCKAAAPTVCSKPHQAFPRSARTGSSHRVQAATHQGPLATMQSAGTYCVQPVSRSLWGARSQSGSPSQARGQSSANLAALPRWEALFLI